MNKIVRILDYFKSFPNLLDEGCQWKKRQVILFHRSQIFSFNSLYGHNKHSCCKHDSEKQLLRWHFFTLFSGKPKSVSGNIEHSDEMHGSKHTLFLHAVNCLHYQVHNLNSSNPLSQHPHFQLDIQTWKGTRSPQTHIWVFLEFIFPHYEWNILKWDESTQSYRKIFM